MTTPRRQPGPILRTIVTPPPSSLRPGQNLLLRPGTVVPGSTPVRRPRAAKLTGAQRDSTGASSDWNKPCHLNPFSTPMTYAWSRTVSDRDPGTVYGLPARLSR